MIILQPIAMVTPAGDIYAPSRLREPKQITYQEFLQKFSGSARSIRVSFEPDGFSNPQPVTAYGFSRDCWYI